MLKPVIGCGLVPEYSLKFRIGFHRGREMQYRLLSPKAEEPLPSALHLPSPPPDLSLSSSTSPHLTGSMFTDVISTKDTLKKYCATHARRSAATGAGERWVCEVSPSLAKRVGARVAENLPFLRSSKFASPFHQQRIYTVPIEFARGGPCRSQMCTLSTARL